ncbi:MAG: bacillithiol biosynthesis cysteine-adding enzyme BshC [Firmicutes bacterium]|nr:bacillithiol biosynthesis cysteine-adding enzyme BshC [Bacillota bacterium]
MLKSNPLPEEYTPALYSDYLAALPQARSFLGVHFSEPGIFAETADKVIAAYRGERRRLSAMLLDYNRALGCSEETQSQAERLSDPRAVAVLAGQQAGLCGGPLYTVYKALAAVKLARRLETELSRPVVPVFWVASEDHDFSEANHFWMLDREDRLRRVDLALPHRGEPVGKLVLPREVMEQVVTSLGELAWESEFSGDVLALLSETGALSATPADWFARLLARLFAAEGLVFFDPLLPQAREMLSPFFSETLAQQDEIRGALLTREAALQASGYPIQVEREEGASLLMWMGERRSALYFRKGNFATRDAAVSFSAAELQELAAASPESLSPNVLLRPLAQDRLFPTVAYIPGPGELAYFAQLLPLYAIFGQQPPVLMPRPGLTVVEPRLSRYIKRYGITENSLLSDVEGYLQQALSRQSGVDLDALFVRLRRQLQQEYADLGGALGHLDSSLVGLAEKNLQHVYAEIAYLQKAALEKERQKGETVVRHFASLKQSLLPRGLLQERVLSFFPFQCKYGPAFWHRLKEEFPEAPGHYLFYFHADVGGRHIGN